MRHVHISLRIQRALTADDGRTWDRLRKDVGEKLKAQGYPNGVTVTSFPVSLTGEQLGQEEGGLVYMTAENRGSQDSPFLLIDTKLHPWSCECELCVPGLYER